MGKNKKIVLSVRHIDGDVTVLGSGEPRLLDTDVDWEGGDPSKVTLVARVLETNRGDHDLLVDAGFGSMYFIPDLDVSNLKPGDIIRFRAHRLDLIEILD